MATSSTYGTVHRSGWTITEGIILVVVGFIALAAPLVTAAFTSLLLPVLLLVEGLMLVLSAFGRSFGSAIWHIILGIIALAAAAAIFAEPVLAVASLPIILGAYLMLKGIAEMAMGGMVPERKGWFYAAGVLSIILGVLVWMQPLGEAVALTGFFIGLSILMLGFLLLMAPAPEKAATGTYT